MQASLRGFAAREIVFVVAIIMGALTVLGVIGYRKVRISSQDKAVLCPLRQLSAAADQYYLENGVSTVAYRDLVGATNYVKVIQTIAGETYPDYYTQGRPLIATGVAGTRTVTYAP